MVGLAVTSFFLKANPLRDDKSLWSYRVDRVIELIGFCEFLTLRTLQTLRTLRTLSTLNRTAMTLAIENPRQLNISTTTKQLLTAMFAGYRRIILRKAFGHGLSGSQVLELRPIKTDGTPELPGVVKIATISLIQKEWQAYQQHIHQRLPYVAEIKASPVLHHHTGWGGLRYTLMGGSTFEIISLHEYLSRPDLTPNHIQTTLERLFRIMHHIWSFNQPDEHFYFATDYNHLLPVNLRIEQKSDQSNQPSHIITPNQLPTQEISLGQWVKVSDFNLVKVNPDTQTLTLQRPTTTPPEAGYYIRCKLPQVDTMAAYPVNHRINIMVGIVEETRISRLHSEINAAFDHTIDPTAATISLPSLPVVNLPNPLLAIPALLQQNRPVNKASIHGDFNLENILIEPETGNISLIDFAEAHKGHVLHDLIRLETEVITKVIPQVLQQYHLTPDLTMTTLYWPLHWAFTQFDIPAPLLPHPDLEKVWASLSTLRQTARQYLSNPDDLTEYYQGLVLYLLGALKFKNLNDLPEHPLPKQTAFWAATLAHYLLTTPPTDPNAPPLNIEPTIHFQPEPATPPLAAEIPTIKPSKSKQQLTALPLESIPTLAPLPPRSRMPLGRNPLFVGREDDLKVLAKALKGHESIAIGQLETAATTGLGGMGKTQLASEFVHRYGQYFAGGVYWLSFADPQAIPAEVAVCGGLGAMELRPNFADLSLEDQLRLVQAAWQEPVPRLLIFDNCEEPELLEQWRPTSGGCRILITSRRANWGINLGLQTLPLDVLPRQESLALLRRHQPDADDDILNAIAQELGDLPLALHMAGSYLARYRRVVTPEKYLEQLQDPDLLNHPSLQGSGLSPTRHIQNVYRTIALSYNRLNPDDPLDQ